MRIQRNLLIERTSCVKHWPWRIQKVRVWGNCAPLISFRPFVALFERKTDQKYSKLNNALHYIELQDLRADLLPLAVTHKVHSSNIIDCAAFSRRTLREFARSLQHYLQINYLARYIQ